MNVISVYMYNSNYIYVLKTICKNICQIPPFPFPNVSPATTKQLSVNMKVQQSREDDRATRDMFTYTKIE